MAATQFADIAYHHVTTTGYGLLFGGKMQDIMAANLANLRLVARFGCAVSSWPAASRARRSASR